MIINHHNHVEVICFFGTDWWVDGWTLKIFYVVLTDLKPPKPSQHILLWSSPIGVIDAARWEVQAHEMTPTAIRPYSL